MIKNNESIWPPDANVMRFSTLNHRNPQILSYSSNSLVYGLINTYEHNINMLILIKYT